jgi:hypothetical protein
MRKSNLKISSPLALVGTALCASAAMALPKFADWSTPASIEALPGSASSLNTPAVDGCVSLSRDGLTLFFNSNRAGNQDIYMAERADVDQGFGEPHRLPEPINTAADEFCPTSVQGNHLYFSRARPGDPGDLFVSQGDREGWAEPEVLDGNINSPLMDESAAFYEDDSGRQVMLFSRRPASGAGGAIFASVDGGPATPLSGAPDSPASDNRPSVTHDGLTLFFDSTRPGGLGGPDLWVATRPDTSVDFGTAINLRALNSPGFDARPTVSWDGTELLFSSIRTGGEGGPDVWRTSREKVRGGPKIITF